MSHQRFRLGLLSHRSVNAIARMNGSKMNCFARWILLTMPSLSRVYAYRLPVPVTVRIRRGSEGARLLGLRVRIPSGHGCLSLVSVVCCKVEISASG